MLIRNVSNQNWTVECIVAFPFGSANQVSQTHEVLTPLGNSASLNGIPDHHAHWD